MRSVPGLLLAVLCAAWERSCQCVTELWSEQGRALLAKPYSSSQSRFSPQLCEQAWCQYGCSVNEAHVNAAV